MENNNEIVDRGVYLSRMNKSLLDKLFFIPMIDPDLIVDFGCADGSLLKQARMWCPDPVMIGYDNDTEMLTKEVVSAMEQLKIKTTCGWAMVEHEVSMARSCNKKSALILSSVIHEIYHYGSPAAIDRFWKTVFMTGFNFIVIRDMIPSRTVDRPSYPDDVMKVYRAFGGSSALSDFEACWGSVENNKNLVHWLLKYRYTSPSWEREVKENYIPLYRESLLSKIPKEYNVVYHEHYVLPYLLRQVRNDFGIIIKDPTHLKLILETGTGCA